MNPFEGWTLKDREDARDSVKAQLQAELQEAAGNPDLVTEIEESLAGLDAVYGLTA